MLRHRRIKTFRLFCTQLYVLSLLRAMAVSHLNRSVARMPSAIAAASDAAAALCAKFPNWIARENMKRSKCSSSSSTMLVLPLWRPSQSQSPTPLQLARYRLWCCRLHWIDVAAAAATANCSSLQLHDVRYHSQSELQTRLMFPTPCTPTASKHIEIVHILKMD